MARTLIHTLVAAALLAGGIAGADEPMLPEPPTQPAATKPATAPEGAPEIILDADREIDLADVVTSAAKGVTTVQEAPAIVTIITSDEIQARGHRWLLDTLGTIPGWQQITALGDQAEQVLVRGVGQAVLLMRDGVSLFDPWSNVAWLGRGQPLETVKRIEVVTGPGGVLWGANSFLGIANLITKDAEDVNGLELSAGYGDGPGDKQDLKLWAMFGKTFWHGRLKVFQHISYERFIGPVFDIPQFIASSPAPQPAGLAYFAKNAPRDPPPGWYLVVDGKLSLGPVSLYYMLPFGDYHPNIGFVSTVGQHNTFNHYDRYGVVEYKDRFAADRIGVNVKAYGIQFVRDDSFQLFQPSVFLPKASPDDVGGLRFTFAGSKIFRFGGTADLDFRLPFHLRLLAGGEFFYEGVRDSNTSFADPLDPRLLPLLCPVDADGTRIPLCPHGYTRDTDRYVAAGYVDAQWRPVDKLTLDGGVRIQKGLGDQPYALLPLYSAAVVYNFLPDFHAKASYATGFRAPVFNNTSTAPGGISYGANPDLKPEGSQSFQGELNMRLLRNAKKVRSLEVRADYSYTVLSELIQIRNGSYGNTGARAIHSAEAYAKLYLNGDHTLWASYTYLYSITSDAGIDRASPSHWASFGASFNLVRNLLDVNVNLNIFGAYRDPDRVPTGMAGNIAGPYSSFVGTTTSAASDLTLDRLTPVADLQLGFRLRFAHDRLQIRVQLYNVLNQRYWYPDIFNDLSATTEQVPTPAPGFSAFGRVSYHF